MSLDLSDYGHDSCFELPMTQHQQWHDGIDESGSGSINQHIKDQLRTKSIEHIEHRKWTHRAITTWMRVLKGFLQV